MKKSERKKQRCVRRRRIETRRNERENERARERERETEGRRRRATAIHVETSEWEAICGESRSIRHSSSVSGIPRSPNRRRFLSPTHPFCLFPFSSLFFFFSFYFLPSISASAYHDITKIREPSRNSAPLNLPCISRVLPI